MIRRPEGDPTNDSSRAAKGVGSRNMTFVADGLGIV